MSEDHDLPTRSEVSGHDIDDARAMYEQSYNGEHFDVEPGSTAFSYRYTSIGDDELTLRGSLFAGSVHGSIRTEGEYVVSWLTAGTGVTDMAEDAVSLGIGIPAIFANNRMAEFQFDDYRQNLLHFDAAYLERIASEHEGSIEGPLLFDTTARPTGDSLRAWGATISTVARVAFDPSTTSLLRSEANRAAAIALLEAFPHAVLAAPPEIIIPRSGVLRTAIEFMYANAHLPIATDAIAEAAGTNLRSLQKAFRAEFDLTAHDYLRRIRLDRVHRELEAADAGTANVADIATKWGFAHLGRFSASYAERFGEYPKATLDQ